MANGFDPARAGALSPAEQRLVERRERSLGPAYRLFYERPVQVVRGEGVWLYDLAGDAYLDAYNNVACVGHAHPQVVGAIARQAATLNTHTRYLDEAILDYSERLLASFPAPLGRVMYTCSGSEAVDLALRVARLATGGTGFIVTASAYHGTTAATAEISPSLGPEVGHAPHVFTVPSPDPFRAAPGQDVGATLAAHVEAAIATMAERGIRLAAMVADTILSSDGIVAEPKGLLAPAVRAVQAAGGLFVADEVQPGFGRTGEAMWGFGRHGLEPDMAVLGKPMGNGMPIAAVVLTPGLADAFGQRVRYFNTFGANNVSIAAAAAVLDVIRDDDLVRHAGRVGRYLRQGLARIAERHPRLGDIRGAGLFVGVECLRDPHGTAPDRNLASAVVNRLRDRHVLISASGPAGNVLKIRPPLPFAEPHADILLDRLGRVMDGLR